MTIYILKITTQKSKHIYHKYIAKAHQNKIFWEFHEPFFYLLDPMRNKYPEKALHDIFPKFFFFISYDLNFLTLYTGFGPPRTLWFIPLVSLPLWLFSSVLYWIWMCLQSRVLVLHDTFHKCPFPYDLNFLSSLCIRFALASTSWYISYLSFAWLC